jgi:ABC-2 type transport system ATP-binding protein
VRVRTPDAHRLATLLVGTDITTKITEPDLIVVNGLPAARIGELAAGASVVLHELTPLAGSLEDAYLALTEDDVEYHAGSFDNTTSATPNMEQVK